MKLKISAPLPLGDTIAKRLARYYPLQLEGIKGSDCSITTVVDGQTKTICSFRSDLDPCYIIELFWLKVKVGDWMR